MLFNSLEFLVFFPVVVSGYYFLPPRYRWILLLAASYLFYMAWRVEYLALLLLSTGVDYFCSRKMDEASSLLKKRAFLYISLFTNLGVLLTFKYYNFFIEEVGRLLSLISISVTTPTLELLLPMGISFYTFQTMSYTIDVYNGRIKAERHLGIFALFVSFFPQLVAGPIERAGNLLSELKKEHSFSYRNVADGLKLMAWGFFKKIVIADRLAIMVDHVYHAPTEYFALPLALSTILFAFQIFCDFSGYSDIAIGAALVLGVKLMRNFNRPYHATSPREFWKRWHISLSTWFRDYVYIPLGGNRTVKWRWYYNLFITFTISGLWHGANWTFIIWGALHGGYLIVSHATSRWRKPLENKLKGVWQQKVLHHLKQSLTFVAVVFAWIFFRAQSLSDASWIVQNMFSGWGESIRGILVNDLFQRLDHLYLGQPKEVLMIAILSIIFMEIIHVLQRDKTFIDFVNGLSSWKRLVLYHVLIGGTIMLGVFEESQFIYFQF